MARKLGPMFTFARTVCLVLAILLAAGLCGCKTLDSKPFADYRDAYTELRKSSEKMLAKDYEWTYNNAVNKSVRGNKDIGEIILEFPGGYAWELSDDAPVFLSIKQTIAAHAALGDVFAQYSTLLAQLAGSELLPADTFTAMAKDVNTNSLSAAKALKLDLGANQAALFSTLAAAAAKAYLEHRRAEDLAAAIKANQAFVSMATRHFSQLTALVAQDMKHEYSRSADAISTRWATASAQDKTKCYEELLKLNEDTITSLESLKGMESAYALFGEKHRQLGESLEAGTFNSFSIADLVAEVKDIRALYESLKTTPTE